MAATPQKSGYLKEFPISLAVRAGDFVVTSAVGDHVFDPKDVRFDDNGVVIDDGSNVGERTFEQEVRGTIEMLQRVLDGAGCTLDDVVDVSVWLKDPRDFNTMNDIFREYFEAAAPTRSVFQTGFMFDCRIEMKALAYKPIPQASN